MKNLELIVAIATIIGSLCAIIPISLFIYKIIKKRLNKKKGQVSAGILDDLPDRCISKFANSVKEFKDVLTLRRNCFGESIIVKDEVYEKCYNTNPDSFKLVIENGNPIGYWGIIPISEKTYNTFLKGGLTHEMILTNEVQRWETYRNKKIYLYIIVVAVPKKIVESKREYHLKSGIVLLDMIDFAMVLFKKHVKVNGICCYTVKYTEDNDGFNLANKFQFATNNVFVNNDKTKPVFYISNKELPQFKEFLRESKPKIKNKNHDRTPKWDKYDKKRFFNLL